MFLFWLTPKEDTSCAKCHNQNTGLTSLSCPSSHPTKHMEKPTVRLSNEQVLVVTAINRTKNAVHVRYDASSQRLVAIARNDIRRIEEKHLTIEGSGESTPGYLVMSYDGQVTACVGDFRDALKVFDVR